MLRTSMGQLLVNEALPEDLRDHGRVLDKKGMNALLRQLALERPDDYVKVSKALNDIGRQVASEFGGYSFGLNHLTKAKSATKHQLALKAQLKQILNRDDLTSKQRNEHIIRAAGSIQQKQIDDVFNESVAENNPLALQVVSGSRGNKMNLASLRGSDLLYADHRDQVIPMPVTRSYSQGLTPLEYWASTYGARRGTMATKFATQDAGFLSKQLNQAAHRLMVVGEDDPRDIPNRGLPVDTDDMDSEGSLLGHDIGPYKRNTVLTPKILKHLKTLGHDRILVRSPLVGGSPDGGVYGRDVGVSEFGRLAGRGSQAGLTAAQALSEPLAQGQLAAKHSGGVAGQEKAVGGFQYINQIIQVPTKFKGVAAHATLDGTVTGIDDAPAGGQHVWIDGQRHYVGAGYALKVKKGDKIEAGDTISEGMPNPAIVVQHKGIGEGRRYFVQALREAMRSADMKADRRNIELLSRGLINHVRLNQEYGDNVPDDVVPYSTIEHVYEPREDHQVLKPERAVGKYLEQPVLHYTIGTRVRPSTVKELRHFGVDEVLAHNDPPPFEPEMIRAMSSLQHDPDWMTRMYGSGLKGSLLDAVHRGAVSDEAGTSFVPSLARAVDFGKVGPVRQPELGRSLPPEGQPFTDLTMPKKKPTDRPTSPIALDIQPKAPAPTFTSRMTGLFKFSTDEETSGEAQAVLLRAKQRLKIASGNNSYPGSSTINTAGQPQSAGMSPPPKPATPLSAPRGTAVPAQPSLHAPLQPKVPQPQKAVSPAAPPTTTASGGVHPQRAEAFYNLDPQEVTSFVAGGGDINQPESGLGGSVGAAMRLGSLFNSNAVAGLSSGRRYAGSQPQTGQPTGQAIPSWLQSLLDEKQPEPGAATTPSPNQPAAVTTKTNTLVTAANLTQLPGAKQLLAGAAGKVGGQVAGKVVGKAVPLIGPLLQAHEGLSMTDDEAREQMSWKMQQLQDAGSSPLGHAKYLGENVLNWGKNLRSAYTSLQDSRTEGKAVKQDADALHNQQMQNPALHFKTLAGKHERWTEAVRNGFPRDAAWTDPVTGTPYTQSEYQDYLNAKKNQDQNGFARETKGLGYGDSLAHDVATRSPVVPGFSEAAIPGTNTSIRPVAGWDQLWSGNWTVNPFKQRSD